MALSGSSPTLSHCRHVRSNDSRLLFLLIATVLCILRPVAVLSQLVNVSPSPSYLSDQPLTALVPGDASSDNSFNFTFAYTSTIPLLLTNATGVSASVPIVGNSNSMPLQLPAVSTAGLRGFLFTSLTSACKRADSAQQGQCTVTVTLSTAQQLVHYSLYTLHTVQYSTTYTDTIPFHTWKYYVRYIAAADLTVGFDLSSPSEGELGTAMFISAAQQLFTPGYPYLTNGSVVINTAIDQTCLLPSTAPDVPDYYIVGLYGFAQTPVPSELQLVSDINYYNSTGGFNGYAILSLLSLILAAGFIGLVLMRGCCLYRRWGSSFNNGNSSITVDRTRSVNTLDPAMFATTAGQSGVLRTDRAAQGATEAEIAALPSKLYVSSVDADGEECEDSRCTICLDEYEPNVSRITTLRCGHTFHCSCVGAWLRQRRHCPLCLQLIDQAQDVKQRRNSTVAEVELVDTRPTIVAIPSPRSAVASRTLVDDGHSVLRMERYSSAAQEEDADMCVVEIGTPHNIGRPPL